MLSINVGHDNGVISGTHFCRRPTVYNRACKRLIGLVDELRYTYSSHIVASQ